VWKGYKKRDGHKFIFGKPKPCIFSKNANLLSFQKMVDKKVSEMVAKHLK